MDPRFALSRHRASEYPTDPHGKSRAAHPQPDLAGGEPVPMADGGEMDEEAMRAFFPLSFGKAPARPSSAASTAAHSSTLRKPQNPSNPKPSASTAADDDGGAMIGPPRPPPAPAGDDEDEDGGGMIGPPRPLPPSARGEGEDEEGGEMIGPPRPSPAEEEDDDEEEEDDDDMEDDGEGEFNRIPLSNEIVLRGHTKVVSALAVDHTGSRVLSGSYDYTVRMYDFQEFPNTFTARAEKLLCCAYALNQIYDRDGLTLGEFVKGDMYIRDLKNTKGHISGLTGGEWNPKSKETILTSSEDGSIRLWDVSDFKSQKQVIKPKLVRPMRIPVTSCAWDHEGKRIVAGIGDGSIQLWTIKTGWGSRPDIHVEKTHTEDITGVKFSTDGQILLSRSMDSTLKIWDLRKMKTPLKVFEDLPNHYAETNAAFSPDEQLIFTGTSIEKDGDNGGLLCFFDRKKLELVSRVGISPQYSVIRCLWHPRINQVFATVGDKKEGGTHILYDPSTSQRGALVCVGRAPRKKSVDDFEVQPVIHNPHALPLFRDQPSRKRQREKILKDPLKSHKPEAPVNGPGFGGRVGTTKGSLLTQYLLKEGGLIKETWMDEDPREAILKYADAAEKDPKFIAPAYSQTQPKPVFAESDSDNEEK
ncbi:WD repeat-containing protein 70 [Dichanthelium oligosanthes]|uniref:WD repeat-containing protein 70 n=1 Tax=Dichanthelium oligosanthes TaxID=888268 RepID=A0A1E5VS83_9POAL|nr:WD repeat-containing protein 70 [Dichanthelium oligosanthes]